MSLSHQGGGTSAWWGIDNGIHVWRPGIWQAIANMDGFERESRNIG